MKIVTYNFPATFVDGGYVSEVPDDTPGQPLAVEFGMVLEGDSGFHLVTVGIEE